MEAAYSIIAASILLFLIVAPMYCCQISNEEYEKIVKKIKENKIKLKL